MAGATDVPERGPVLTRSGTLEVAPWEVPHEGEREEVRPSPHPGEGRTL